ncbi:WXG100-like domain-containing protein [Streptomyces fuscigenes]|uniref:WXG100-like domain-containing protein n=1 Tax=Streptomyces fuscigenes TaxID=1528880 RepID=UPI001F2C9C9F|nr:hypothetical protein [Streptomyces fuscigenes]MCF3961495.1 hypothetical protein [Streptomyces fuscigenes]
MSLRAEGGGGGGDRPIDLYPDDLDGVAGQFATGQTNLDTAASALNAALRSAAGMAGNDDYGHRFAGKYDAAAKALFHTLSAGVRAIGQASNGLVTTANNYLKADHHSNPSKGKGAPKLYPWPPVITDVMYPDPASAVGPGHSSVPSVIAKYWPNGHQDKLRDAASAYRTAATAIEGIGRSLHGQVQSLTDNNSDDSVTAMAAFWGKVWQDGGNTGKAPLSAAHDACGKLASACDKFAHAIDEAHSSTEEKLAGAGIAIGLTTALGVVLTVVTAGASDAGAAALDGAEAGAILGGVEATAEAAIADIDTAVIADAATELDAAAEAVPEIEAVDAETTEVDEALDEELSETEARDGDGPGEEDLPKTYEQKSEAVRDILTDDDGNLIGEEDSKGVRMVTEEQLQQARTELQQRLGEPTIKSTPKGDIETWRLSDDPPSTVTYRPFSKSGGPTIDMNDVDGLEAKRLHIPQH